MTFHCRKCKDIATLEVSQEGRPHVVFDRRVQKIGSTVVHRPGVCDGVMQIIL